MMGLRLSGGVPRASFRRELAGEPEKLFGAKRLGALQDAGYLVLDGAGLRATAAGLQRLDAVLGYLLTDAGAA
jgi:oxygen-independent coproporphyrinogen-3 oxidase